MTVYHHRSADIVAKHVLQKWRRDEWDNVIISNNVTLASCPADFPSPDADFEDFSRKKRISFEFKPHTETKRGMMTGLGQAIAYLKKAHGSYLVSPSEIEDFNMETFLLETFNEFIEGKLPVGLIIYDGINLENIRIICDIHPSFAEQTRELTLTKEPYWCWWRDSPPDLSFKLGLSALAVSSKQNRSKLVWDHFWDNYFALPSTRSTVENIDSDVFTFDMATKMIPFETLKKDLRAKLESNQVTNTAALNELKIKGWGQGYLENNYQNFKKNFTIFMDHINFWDENKSLTPLGLRFIERYTACGNDSSKIIDEFAQILLVEGKHDSLISDLETISEGMGVIRGNFSYNKDLYDALDKKGYIAKNPNRTSSGARKPFQSEKQLWGHLKIIKKNGNTYFFENKGFIFDKVRIEFLVTEFYKNYADVSGHIDNESRKITI